MRALLTALLFASPLALAGGGPPPGGWPLPPESSTVASVYDGDTVTLATGDKIRLRWVNTPELKPAEAYGIEARDAAKEFLTGEITLRGEVLPIGGLKEKLLAARRGGISVVLIPDENARDLTEIPKNIKKDLDIRPVKWIDEVFQVALQHMPTPLPEEADEEVKESGKEGSQNGLRAH